MSVEMLFIIASLIFGLAVIVGANIWALREPSPIERQRSLSRAIDEILGAENTVRRPDRKSARDGDHRA